jgi:hypothetical protein
MDTKLRQKVGVWTTCIVHIAHPAPRAPRAAVVRWRDRVHKTEHDRGFFVKLGEAQVDFQVIGHLQKSRVYQLAMHLGVPEEIRQRPPTSDAYGAECKCM